MSLSVLNNIASLYAQANLNNTQTSLQNTLEQLSSGSRINSGADDAAGLAVADGLAANEAALTQSAANATDGIGLLQTADGALSQVTSLLDRAITLATEAANGGLTTAQVGSANQEYQNILTQIGNIGSSTNYNSTSVFSSTPTQFVVTDGTSSGLVTYNDSIGTLSTANVGTTAATSTTLSTVTNTVAGTPTAVTPTGPTTPTDSTGGTATFTPDAAGDSITGTLSVSVGGAAAVTETFAAGGVTLAAAEAQINGDAAFTSAGISASVSGGSLVITGPTGAANTLDVSASNLTDVTTTNAIANPTPTAPTDGTGASTDITLASATDTLSGNLSVAVAGGTALTETFAAGTTLAQAEAQINGDSAFSTAGVVASVSGSTLTLTGPTGAANTLDLTGTSLDDSNSTTSPGASTPTASAGAAGTLTFTNATDTVGGSLEVTVGSGTAINVKLSSGETIAQAVAQLNGDSDFTAAGLTAAQGTGTAANTITITGPTGATNTLSFTGTAVTDSVIGAGADFTAGGLGTLTATNASSILSTLNTAVSDVSYQRGTIGADINELNSASSVASSEEVNLASAANTILATNFGQATSDLSKYQVLDETGIAALAQANSTQQEVVKLLQQ